MSITLGFIIPFKPQSQSRNWENDNLMLNHTLRAVLRQTHTNFRVYVVYTDEPLEKENDEKIVYLKYPFPFLNYDEVDAANPGEFLPSATGLVERRFDKGRKIMYGCKKAKEDGCMYLMNVDADDLVSNRIVQFVADHHQNHTCAGWYIPNGYVWNADKQKLYKQRNMHLFNGSTHILSSSVLPIPEPESLHWQHFNWFVAHGWTRIRFRDKLGKELLAVPFYAIVYVAHQSNISGVMESISRKSIKGVIKRLLMRKRVTKSIRQAFNLNPRPSLC